MLLKESIYCKDSFTGRAAFCCTAYSCCFVLESPVEGRAFHRIIAQHLPECGPLVWEKVLPKSCPLASRPPVRPGSPSVCAWVLPLSWSLASFLPLLLIPGAFFWSAGALLTAQPCLSVIPGPAFPSQLCTESQPLAALPLTQEASWASEGPLGPGRAGQMEARL